MVEIETTWKQWLSYLVRGKPHQVIFNDDNPTPYLLRWYMLPRNRFLNVYLHKFLRSDDDRALHDHPWWFVSWIIKGYYLEYTDTPPNPHVRKRWSWAYRPANWRHRVDLPWTIVRGFDIQRPKQVRNVYIQEPVWTIVITGPKCRTWGFWCKEAGETESSYGVAETFIPWHEWVESRGCAEP